MTNESLEALAEEIKALSPPDQLRLAADLMERKRGDVAHIIIERISIELGAVIAEQKLARRAAPSGGDAR